MHNSSYAILIIFHTNSRWFLIVRGGFKKKSKFSHQIKTFQENQLIKKKVLDKHSKQQKKKTLNDVTFVGPHCKLNDSSNFNLILGLQKFAVGMSSQFCAK